MLQDVLAPLYADLIEHICAGGTNEGAMTLSERFEVWPVGSNYDRTWDVIAHSTLHLLWAREVFWSATNSGRCLSGPNSVFYCRDGQSDNLHETADILAANGFPLVELPRGVLDLLRSMFGVALIELNPSLARDQMRKVADVEAAFVSLNRAKALLVLEYLLSDGADDVESLQGIPLIPLRNGSLSTFRPFSKDTIILTTADDERFLMQRASFKLVDWEIPIKVWDGLCRVARKGRSCIKYLSADLLAASMEDLLPLLWRGRDSVSISSDCDPAFSAILSEWLKTFWSYLSRVSGELQMFEGWPLVPTIDNRLFSLQNSKSILLAELPSDSADVSTALSTVGVAMVAIGRFALVHGQLLDRYVHAATVEGILRALGAIQLSSPGEKNVLYKTGNEGIRSLRRYFGQRIRGVCLSISETDTLHGLKMFQTLEGSDYVSIDRRKFEFWVPPKGCDASNLPMSACFIDVPAEDEGDILKLLSCLDVVQLTKAAYFRQRIFPRICELTASKRESTMRQVLEELSILTGEDGSFVNELSNLPFLEAVFGDGTARGDSMLQAPNCLYDPTVPILKSLFGEERLFIGGSFSERSHRNVLRSLGLRSTLTVGCCFKCIDAISRSMSEEAADKEHFLEHGKLLLQWLDKNLGKLTFSSEGNTSRKAFFLKLCGTVWLPVMNQPPKNSITWKGLDGPKVSTAGSMRLRCDSDLVGSSMLILDCDVSSAALKECFGWSSPPPVMEVVQQLLDVAEKSSGLAPRKYSKISGIVASIYDFLSTHRMTAASEEVAVVKLSEKKRGCGPTRLLLWRIV